MTNLNYFINLFGEYVLTPYLCNEVLGSFRLVVSFRLVEGKNGRTETCVSFCCSSFETENWFLKIYNKADDSLRIIRFIV